MKKHLIILTIVISFYSVSIFSISKIYIKNEYQPIKVTIFSSNKACPQPLKNELISVTKSGVPYTKIIQCPLRNCITKVIIKNKDDDKIAEFAIKPDALCKDAYIQLNKVGSIWWGTVKENGTFLLPEEEPIIVTL